MGHIEWNAFPTDPQGRSCQTPQRGAPRPPEKRRDRRTGCTERHGQARQVRLKADGRFCPHALMRESCLSSRVAQDAAEPRPGHRHGRGSQRERLQREARRPTRKLQTLRLQGGHAGSVTLPGQHTGFVCLSTTAQCRRGTRSSTPQAVTPIPRPSVHPATWEA